MSNCPREIRTTNGPRLVYCGRWNCEHCAPQKREDLVAAARLHFQNNDCTAATIRAADVDLRTSWQRIRNRIAGASYIAVIQKRPDVHMHLMCSGIDPDALRRHIRESGARSDYVKPVDDVRSYANYIGDTRAKGTARISHSRDMTQTIRLLQSDDRVAAATHAADTTHRKIRLQGSIDVPGIHAAADFGYEARSSAAATPQPDPGPFARHIAILQALEPFSDTIDVSITIHQRKDSDNVTTDTDPGSGTPGQRRTDDNADLHGRTIAARRSRVQEIIDKAERIEDDVHAARQEKEVGAGTQNQLRKPAPEEARADQEEVQVDRLSQDSDRDQPRELPDLLQLPRSAFEMRTPPNRRKRH